MPETSLNKRSRCPPRKAGKMIERSGETLRLEEAGGRFGQELFAGAMPIEVMAFSDAAHDHRFFDSSLSPFVACASFEARPVWRTENTCFLPAFEGPAVSGARGVRPSLRSRHGLRSSRPPARSLVHV